MTYAQMLERGQAKLRVAMIAARRTALLSRNCDGSETCKAEHHLACCKRRA